MIKVLLGTLLIVQCVALLVGPALEQGIPIPPGRRTADQQANGGSNEKLAKHLRNDIYP